MNNLTLEQHKAIVEWQEWQLEQSLDYLHQAEFKHQIEDAKKRCKNDYDRLEYLNTTPQKQIKYTSWELMSLQSKQWFKENIRGSD
jgi:hypothetical protein